MADKATAEEADRPPLRETLQLLADGALRVALQMKEKGELASLSFPAQRLVLNDFSYTDEGVDIRNAHTVEATYMLWDMAAQAVVARLAGTPEFRMAEARLTARFPGGGNPKSALERLVCKMVSVAGSADPSAADTGNIVDRFIAEFGNTPVLQKAIAELYDLALFGCEFDFESQDVRYRLRPTCREDIEGRLSLTAFDTPFSQGYPDAILELSLLAENHLALQGKVEEAVGILILYRPVAVSHRGYRVESPAVIPRSTGMQIGGGRRRGACRGRLLPSDELVQFWKGIHGHFSSRLLPEPGQTPSSLQIAHGLYLDALWTPAAPHRIATAVMGLEALLSDGLGGSKYKLAVRVAKLLSCFGIPALRVKCVLEEAYRIRSGYVHGGYFKSKDAQKLARLEGSSRRFTELLLDYLRVCAVMCLVVDVDKGELLRLVDDALVDQGSQRKLADRLLCAQPFCGLSPLITQT